MDIRWVEDFLSLAETRNFSRSANDRGITQSAFSRRIRALEEWVGTDLVDRSTYPLNVTSAGKIFGRSASEAIRLLNDSRALLRTDGTDHGMLRISAGHNLALNFLPAWLGSLQQRHGEMRARILPSNVRDSVCALMEGNCDMLVCYHHVDLPIDLDPVRFDCIDLGHEVVLPVSVPDKNGSPSYRLPGSKTNKTPCLGYPYTSFFGRVVERILSQVGEHSSLINIFESDMVELLKTIVLEGGGVAWLPHSCIVRELAEGKLVRAGGNRWTITLDIRLVRASENKNPVLEKLWQDIMPRSRREGQN